MIKMVTWIEWTVKNSFYDDNLKRNFGCYTNPVYLWLIKKRNNVAISNENVNEILILLKSTNWNRLGCEITVRDSVIN